MDFMVGWRRNFGLESTHVVKFLDALHIDRDRTSIDLSNEALSKNATPHWHHASRLMIHRNNS